MEKEINHINRQMGTSAHQLRVNSVCSNLGCKPFLEKMSNSGSPLERWNKFVIQINRPFSLPLFFRSTLY